MKRALFTLLLICVFSFCKAQYISAKKPVYKTVYQDTINIRGIVYDASNQPAPSIMIRSKNAEIVFDGYPIYAVTDKNGQFELNGALVKDTLDFLGENLSIVNNGSRYIEIHLPPRKINAEFPGEITAQRQFKKNPTPAFKVQSNVAIMDYYGMGLTQDAEFKGSQKFVDYIKSKITYPQKAIKNNIEGDVEVAFTIDKDGTVKNIRIVRGIGYDCDEVVLNAFINCHKWKPAIVMSNPIEYQSSITINFKLTDK